MNRKMKQLWVAVRFIVFGVGGFVFMFFCWAAFLDRMTGGDGFALRPFLSLPLTVLGALVMLFGVGEWGRWAYLFAFLSIPLSTCLYFLPMFEHSDKVVGFLIPATAAVFSFVVVRMYYAHRAKRRASIGT